MGRWSEFDTSTIFKAVLHQAYALAPALHWHSHNLFLCAPAMAMLHFLMNVWAGLSISNSTCILIKCTQNYVVWECQLCHVSRQCLA